MSEEQGGSTIPRREFGRVMRKLREKKDLNATDASKLVNFSRQKLWKIEGGEQVVNPNDAEKMCRVYGASPELSEALVALARETNAKGWWQSYRDVIPGLFEVYVGLESAASELDWYESELVPGLLQTESYVRALSALDESTDASELDRRVQVRFSRQNLLTKKNPLKLDVVLNEAVIRRPVGGSKVMVEQLTRLLELNDLPNVNITVIPFSQGAHHGLLCLPFVLLRFPEVGGLGRIPEPPTVYVEGFNGCLYQDQPHEIDRYEWAFSKLQKAAVKSHDLLHKAIKEITGS